MICAIFFTGLAIVPSVLGRFDWTIDNGKRLRLLGNSFGVGYKNATYDYVVVGGGTGGLAIASRLAENPNVTVAVVEAGGFYETNAGNTSQVPAYGSTYLAFDDLEPNYQSVDWDFITLNQTGLNDRQIHYTAGKTLGGSSAVNDMIFHRGTQGAFEWWANVTGDDSYTWANFLPYLEKSVAFSPPNFAKLGSNVSIPYDDSVFSSTGGPLHVSYPNYRGPFDPHMEKALAKSGLNLTKGFNSGSLDGYGAGTYTIDAESETRSSSEESFLQQALGATSLKVYHDTMARKILFDGNKTAIGVEVQTNGANYTLAARKEIVVSSGVFGSPKLLMLSGIGPAEQLKTFDIPVVSNLHGVGNNLIDQVFLFTSHEVNLTTDSGTLTNPELHAAAVERYLAEQNGPLTGVGGEILAFEKIPDRAAFTEEAQKELATLPADWAEVEYLGLSLGSNPDDEPLANNYMFFTASVFAPFSYGYVNLSSSLPEDDPIINPNSLSSSTETQVAVQALKRMREFAEASGVQVREVLPGANVTSDAQIEQWVRNNAVNGYHAACSCKMGQSSDPDAVVDSRARVFGVSGLRVVDASAFAILPPGHPMSTIYALAEKIAEDMLSS